jgi:hypothetical protein
MIAAARLNSQTAIGRSFKFAFGHAVVGALMLAPSRFSSDFAVLLLSLCCRDTRAAYVVPATRRRPRRPARTGYGGRHDRSIRWLVRGHHTQMFAEHSKPEEKQRDAGIDDGDRARPLSVCKPIGFANEGLSNHPRASKPISHRGAMRQRASVTYLTLFRKRQRKIP